jgi:uncharacterized short protein YbdD (DUF466 family)
MTEMHAIDGKERLDQAVPRPGVVQLPSLDNLSIRARVQKVLRVVRTIIGVPNYEAYVRHHSENYPGCSPMTRQEFEKERMIAKYYRPGSRCC